MERLAASLAGALGGGNSTGSLPGGGTTEAWLSRAFPSALHADEDGGGGGSRLVPVLPHALDEHVPALVGPLRLSVSGEGAGDGGDSCSSLLEFSEPEDRFVALTHLRHGTPY